MNELSDEFKVQHFRGNENKNLVMQRKKTSNSIITNVNETNSAMVISEVNFQSLLKTVQLLRISQLRYLVQKFSIPVSGNKTKLLNLVIEIFKKLRTKPVLLEIHQEINQLLSNQDTFSNSQQTVKNQLELSKYLPDFSHAFNPLIECLFNIKLYGPILARPGVSSGFFWFETIPHDSMVMIQFLFPGGEIRRFSLSFRLNGIPFEIYPEDDVPTPLDVSDVLMPVGTLNTFSVDSMETESDMQMVFIGFRYVGVNKLIEQVCNRSVDIKRENIFVKSLSCQHIEGFSLLNHISNGLATFDWSCPCCGCSAGISELIVLNSDSYE